VLFRSRRLAGMMSEAAAAEYRGVIEEAERLAAGGETSSRGVDRLRRELRRIAARDHFPPKERDLAHRAVERLAAELERAER
jgi:hypothetical protein